MSAAQEGKANASGDVSEANVPQASAFGLVPSSTSDRKDELRIDRFEARYRRLKKNVITSTRLLRDSLLQGGFRYYLANARKVVEMSDGGMGSLKFLNLKDEIGERTFGSIGAQGMFKDADGIDVSVALNLDMNGDLLELDMWKVDFSPLIRLPKVNDL